MANHPDDRFFKEVMSKKSSVIAYLTHFNPEIGSLLDLDTLESSSESFIDEKLDVFESDIIYRCQFKNSEEQIYISFLWEHKSSPETYVSLQIGLYILLALHKMSKQKGQKLEMIIPFLFYNGATNWQPKTIHGLFRNSLHFEIFKNYIPQFDFIFKNITSTNELELLTIKDAFFRSAMFAMASRNNADLIIQRISSIFGTEEEGEVFVILNYILHFTLREGIDITDNIKQLNHPLKSKAMSVMEEIRETLKEFYGPRIQQELRVELEDKVRDELRGKLEDEVKDKLKNELRDSVSNDMKDEVRNEIKDEVRIELKDENSKEVILNMYKMGLDIQTIIQATQRDFEFVNNVIQEVDNA